jgi:hypothetical protein
VLKALAQVQLSGWETPKSLATLLLDSISLVEKKVAPLPLPDLERWGAYFGPQPFAGEKAAGDQYCSYF